MRHNLMSRIWLEKWSEAMKNHPPPSAAIPLRRQVELWNSAAKELGPSLGMNDGRIEAVLGIIKSLDIITKESTVLDIGCGTGAYALPFAKIAGSVEAIDFSPEMIRVLQARIGETRVRNINAGVRDFASFSRWAKAAGCKFDVVFASLNPGVYSGRAIEKMTSLSQRFCVYIGSAGIRGKAAARLDKLLLENEPRIGASDVSYPFNMLYHMGYKPQIYYAYYISSRRETRDEAILRLVRDYSRVNPDAHRVRKTVERYVDENTKGGAFVDEHKGALGVLIWSVN